MKDKREEPLETDKSKSEPAAGGVHRLRQKYLESNFSVTGRRIGASVNFLTNGESSNSGKAKIFLKFENNDH